MTTDIPYLDHPGHVSKKRDFNTPKPLRPSDSLRDLSDVGVVELLEDDQRPTFLLDIGATSSCDGTNPHLVYYNEAMKSLPAVLEQIQSLYDLARGLPEHSSWKFRDWTLESASPHQTGANQFCRSFRGYMWAAVMIRGRWRLFSGSPGPSTDDWDKDDSAAIVSPPTAVKVVDGLAKFAISQNPTGRPLDWTLPNSCFETTSHIERVRMLDWGSTPLGDMKSWSESLRLTVNLLMSDTSPACVYWGQELTTIYNEAFIPICRTKHPWGLGRPFTEVYADIEDQFTDFYHQVLENGLERGKSTTEYNQRFVAALHNEAVEEIFFSFSVLPVLKGGGEVGGLYASVKDVTRSIVSARREAALRAASDAKVDAADPNSFWEQWVDILSADEYDIVSVFAYSVRSVVSAPSAGDAQDADAPVLEAFSTVAMDDRGVPYAHDIMRKDGDLMGAFSEALQSGEPQTYPIDDTTLANALLMPIRSWRDSDVPRQLALCPTNPKLPSQGILVIALNPYRPYDAEFQKFVSNLARDISGALAASEKARFAERAIIESELRFSQMTATSPAAHFEVNLEGQILYVNERWHSITGMPRSANQMPAMSWLQLVYEPDLPVIQMEWARLREGKSVSFEIRLKKEWQATNPFSGEALELKVTWVLAMASQHETTTGPKIMGCLVDINRQKWAEDFHKRKTEEAIEMKCQQERFIDMTSHEMRNPLSAIFQCSDSIVSLLESVMKSSAEGGVEEKNGMTTKQEQTEALHSCIEAAQTISFCAQHQKRIVDDVLLLSKMDANMIEVTAVDTNPKQLVERGLGIFASEVRANGIQLEFCEEQSYRELGVDWVRLDPSRLLQILINLTTNALKFTLSEAKERRIKVCLGASTTPPSHLSSDDGTFTYLPPSGDMVDPTLRPEWGSGEVVYLHLSVEDTGRGISEVEMRELFMRFKQASPRTHVEYGGSGLGLHIARQLAEMQGGQIGVISERGQGSTFAFYIKARRCNPGDVPLPAARSQMMTFSGQTESKMALPKAHWQCGEVSRPSTGMGKLGKLHVLIVEDNLVNQKVLSKQLQKLGWNVAVANHGLEALEALKQTVLWSSVSSSTEDRRALDLVLMDIEMPIMDGLTATREIRRLEAEGTMRGHVPIIAVSANARSEQISKATAAGIDDIVSKPFRIPQLVTKIEQLLGVGEGEWARSNAEVSKR